MTCRHLAWVPLALLFAACATPPAPSAEVAQARQASLECRQDADRILERRDRAELIRREEQESRLGAGDYAGPVTQIDRLAMTWQRDRMAAACLRGRNETLETAPGQAVPAAVGAAPGTAVRPLPGTGATSPPVTGATSRPGTGTTSRPGTGSPIRPGTALPPPQGS